MSYDHTPPAWRVAEFWSSSNPGKKVLVLAEDQEIIEWSKRSDFIRWMDDGLNYVALPTHKVVIFGKPGVNNPHVITVDLERARTFADEPGWRKPWRIEPIYRRLQK